MQGTYIAMSARLIESVHHKRDALKAFDQARCQAYGRSTGCTPLSLLPSSGAFGRQTLSLHTFQLIIQVHWRPLNCFDKYEFQKAPAVSALKEQGYEDGQGRTTTPG